MSIARQQKPGKSGFAACNSSSSRATTSRRTDAEMSRIGDMDPEAFRREAHRVVDWLADYLAHPDTYPVLSRVQPGDVRDALPTRAPESGEPFDLIFADFEHIIVPGLTHWNHPGFFAYFATT